MEKKYDPKQVEPRIQKFWADNKIYTFDPKSKKPVFSIDTPPPTISGKLHIGHIMHYTQFEIIARYKRMRGFNVFFPFGYDDNGLPTEKYVEETKNISKLTVEKKEFRNMCLEASEKLRKEYTIIFKRLGFSVDWSHCYHTIDDYCQKQSQRSFVELYNKGEIYRSNEPVIWCPYHQTALSQAEVESKDKETQLNYIYFTLEDDSKIEIATTRPELLASCVGIFVHPDDKRYKKMVGKKAIVPIFGQNVPIIKDEKVDMEFGSGIVMICTFGDTADIEWWKIHKLPLKISINKDGTLNELAGKYKGLKIEEARKKIIDDLKSKNIIFKQESLDQTVGTCWRCGTPVEYIVSEQWFVRTLKYKDKLDKLGNELKWYPAYYVKRFLDWNNNLKWDWCISRQRYYGVPFPVWYCSKCKKIIIANEEDLPVDPEKQQPKKSCECGSDKFIAETDVMDTWMTSSMTPFIVTRWKDDDKFFKKMFPMSLRPCAHDIISFWNYRTVLKGYLHKNSLPWHSTMISGHGLDKDGKKMSKSLGNIVEPLPIAEKYGADCIRYWTATAEVGKDLFYKEDDITKGNKLLIKLWNASRFACENLTNKKPKQIEPIDKWLLVRLEKTIDSYTEALDNYKISKGKMLVEQFFWKDFCDNYLEIVKHRLYNEDKTTESAKYTLYKSLLAILKMFAPIMPHVTEEIYQNFFKKHEKTKSIHISDWPEKEDAKENNGQLAVDAIVEIRKYKHDNKMALNAELNKVIISTKEDISEFVNDIKGAMKIKEIEFKTGKELKIEVI